jgi:FkbM family methyltransferase
MIRDGLRRVFRSCRVTIADGPNRGLRWSLATTGRGYGRGTFEAERLGVILAMLRPGDCVWDVGAHKGYVSLAAARRVGPTGRVYAFEPSEANLWFLRNHIRWNSVANVEVVAGALGDRDGIERFGGRSSLAKKLGGGDEVVRVRRAETLLDSGACRAPQFLKIDVEGAEARVLRGASALLRRPDVAVLVATHAPALASECRAILEGHGLRIHESGSLRAANAGGWEGRGDPDLLALGPARVAPEEGLRHLACA